METVRLRISGRVQGVGYRFWAEQTAHRLGLQGWVRNRADGSVEILATGMAANIAALAEACRRGPRAADVEHVAVEPAADDGSAGFTARPTL
ncbi:MAG: acylphosphatase [Alphaproteobacteria bacterium]|nr:acylphosphatase [Alphaproteobacteria bacterium]MBV9861787.1 acylphosphatase [Alphaproteobacteria bacterium]